MKIAIYMRKSISDPQSESIENQFKLCIAYCKDKFKCESITEYCDDGYTGKNTNRPGFQKLLNDIESNTIDIVVVYKMDRIFRNTRDFYNMVDIFKKHNIKFISITENFDLDSHSGLLVAGIYSIFAQFERDTTSQRVKDNMYESAKKGYWLGGPAPFGYKFYRFYDNNKKLCLLEEDYEKSEIVKLLFNKYLEFKSLTKLEKYAKEHSITGARGNLFNITSISSILKSPVYVKSSPEVVQYLKDQNMNVIGDPDYLHGFVTYAKNSSSMPPIATISYHNGIIDSDVWLNVQKIISKNSKAFPRQGTSKKAFLSGIIKCKHCGSNMTTFYKAKKDDGTQLGYYICSNKRRNGKNVCDCENLNMDYIDSIVINEINNINIQTLLTMFKNKNLFTSNSNSYIDEASLIKNNINIKNRNLSNLTNALSTAQNEMVINTLLSKMELISNEINDLQSKLSCLESNLDNSIYDEAIDNLTSILRNFKQFLKNEPLESKQSFINSIADKIEWDSKNKKLNIIYK